MMMPIEQRACEGWQNLPDNWSISLRKILAARGIQQASDLTYTLDGLPQPDELKDMDRAVSLLITALAEQSKILIVADFDADGATSCAVLMRGLKAFGFQKLDFIVPNRFIHGYGLSTALLNDLSEKDQPDLLITVDNGIASNEGVALAKQRGMKVLITDHHLPGEVLPNADAIVNPNQHGDAFTSKALAGVGVAFYLLLGLRQKLRQLDWFQHQAQTEPRLVELLDLVVLGTIADLVPLDRLNRTLAQLGLQRIRHQQSCLGIKSLLRLSSKTTDLLSSQDLAFAVAPKLNAAGRMEDMRIGIELLITEDKVHADYLAQQLEIMNQERREVEQDMQSQANQMLSQLHELAENQLAYCLYHPEWHQGVVGLLASRIKDKVYRPVFAFAEGDKGELKGSARSIQGVHIRDVLVMIDAQHPDMIKRFGGHAMAAGLTLEKAQLAQFETALLSIMPSIVDPQILTQQYWSDGELNTSDICLPFAQQLPTLIPWGQHFSAPQFHGIFHIHSYKAVGQQADHLRLTLLLDDGRQIIAMAFKQTAPDWLAKATQVLLQYRLDINEFRQQRSVQLLVDALFPA